MRVVSELAEIRAVEEAQLEAYIRHATEQIKAAHDPRVKRAFTRHQRELIQLRSPEKVAEMERERNLI